MYSAVLVINIRWQSRLIIALTVFFFAACGAADDSTEPVDAAEPISTQTSTSLPSIAAAPPATAALSLDEMERPPVTPLVLDLEEEGAVDGVVLGAPLMVAVAHFVDKLGVPDRDSGWFESCYTKAFGTGFSERVLQWGSFYLYFNSNQNGILDGWSYHVDPTTFEPLPGGPTPDVLSFPSEAFGLGDPLSAHDAQPAEPVHVQDLWYVTTRTSGFTQWVLVADEVDTPVYGVHYGNFIDCRLFTGNGTDALESLGSVPEVDAARQFFIDTFDDAALSGVPFGTDSMTAYLQLAAMLGPADNVSRVLPPCGGDFSADVLVSHARWGSLFAHFTFTPSTLAEEFVGWSYEAHPQMSPEGEPQLYDAQLQTVPSPELIVMPDGSRVGDVASDAARPESVLHFSGGVDYLVAGDDSYMTLAQAEDGRVSRVSVPARELCVLTAQPNA